MNTIAKVKNDQPPHWDGTELSLSLIDALAPGHRPVLPGGAGKASRSIHLSNGIVGSVEV